MNEESGLLSSDKYKLNSAISFDLNYDKMFLAISFAILFIEATSTIFNISVKGINIPNNVIATITVFFYMLHAMLTIFMIACSIFAIKQALTNKKNKVKDKSSHSKLIKHQDNTQIAENILTVASHIVWLAVCFTSVVMLYFDLSNKVLENFTLIASVLAPALSIISCIIRLSNMCIQHKTAESNNKKKIAKIFLALYSIMLVFETIHCICHVFEAISLGGKMQDLYSFGNKTILGLELATILIFMIVFCIENYIEKSFEKVNDQSNTCDDHSITSGVLSHEKIEIEGYTQKGVVCS